jgi:hypothetical protein
MSDPRNVAHDKKIIHEKQKHGENLAKDAAHIPQPGKKTARETRHGAHTESEAEEAGGTSVDPKA